MGARLSFVTFAALHCTIAVVAANDITIDASDNVDWETDSSGKTRIAGGDVAAQQELAFSLLLISRDGVDGNRFSNRGCGASLISNCHVLAAGEQASPSSIASRIWHKKIWLSPLHHADYCAHLHTRTHFLFLSDFPDTLPRL